MYVKITKEDVLNILIGTSLDVMNRCHNASPLDRLKAILLTIEEGE